MNNFLFTIELTGHCNLKCIHCLRESTKLKKELPFSIFKKIIKQAKKYNKPHFAFTGGEPTIHKDFFKILNYISDEGFSFHFVTNGFNFRNICHKVISFWGRGLKIVCFSLDGATESTHDRIRVKGSYRKVLEGIAICKAKKIPVSVQMVVNKLNRHEIRDMAHLGSKMGFDKLYFCHLQPTFGSSTFNISLPPDEWLKIEEEVEELKPIFTTQITISAGFFDETPLAHCQFLQGCALNIDYDGNLTFCCQLSNMFDSSLKKDIICNLKKTPLLEGHKMLIDRISEINKKRIDAIEKGTITRLDFFHCWFCLKEFRKIDWMGVLKDNSWAKEDPYFKKMERKWGKQKEIQN